MRIKEILDNVLDELNRAEDLLNVTNYNSEEMGDACEELIDDIKRDRDRLNAVYDELESLGVGDAELDVE